MERKRIFKPEKVRAKTHHWEGMWNCVAPPGQQGRKENAEGYMPATTPQKEAAQGPRRNTFGNWEKWITGSLYKTFNSIRNDYFLQLKNFSIKIKANKATIFNRAILTRGGWMEGKRLQGRSFKWYHLIYPRNCISLLLIWRVYSWLYFSSFDCLVRVCHLYTVNLPFSETGYNPFGS